MDKAVLDRAVKALADLNVKPQQARASTPESRAVGTAEPEKTDWSPESEARRFGQRHARFFPFIGRKVRTPAGPGTLLQVFEDRVTVMLDSDLCRCSFFRPAETEPVSWEV